MLKLSDIKDSYKHIIAGKGPAGAFAAKFLKQIHGEEWFNENVLIIEAEAEAGGRTKTDPIFGDEGASWFHIDDPRYYETEEGIKVRELIEHYIISLAEEKNYKLYEDKQDLRFTYNGVRIDKELYYAYVTATRDELKMVIETRGDMLLVEALKDFNERYNPYPEDVLKKVGITAKELNEYFMRTEYGWSVPALDVEKVSAVHAFNHNSCDAGYIMGKGGVDKNGVSKEGMGNFIREVARETDEATIYNARVKKITAKEPFSAVKIVTPEGEKTVYANHIINSIPTPEFVKKVAGEKYVETNFPKKMKEAPKDLLLGKMNKVMFHVAPEFFKKNGIDIQHRYNMHVDGVGDLFFIARPGDWPTVVGLFGGDKSVELESLGVDAAKEFALKLVDAEPELAGLIDHIIGVKYTTWDKKAHGSYSASDKGKGNSRNEWGSNVGYSVVNAGEACPPTLLSGRRKRDSKKEEKTPDTNSLISAIEKMDKRIEQNKKYPDKKGVYEKALGVNIGGTQTHLLGAVLTGIAATLTVTKFSEQTKNTRFSKRPDSKMVFNYAAKQAPAPANKKAMVL